MVHLYQVIVSCKRPIIYDSGIRKSRLTGSDLFVLMSQWENNNELALQHSGFCTMCSLVAKGLLYMIQGLENQG